MRAPRPSAYCLLLFGLTACNVDMDDGKVWEGDAGGTLNNEGSGGDGAEWPWTRSVRSIVFGRAFYSQLYQLLLLIFPFPDLV